MKNLFSSYKFCYKFMKGYRIGFWFYMFLLLLIIPLSLLEPLFFSYIINNLIEKNKNMVFYYLILTLILFLTKTILSFFSTRMSIKIKRNLNIKIKENYASYILNIPQHKIREYNHGRMISILINETSNITEFLFTFSNFLLKLLNTVILAVILFRINIFLSLVILVTLPISYFIDAKYGKKLKSKSKKLLILNENFIGSIKNIITNLIPIKTNQAQTITFDNISSDANDIKTHTIEYDKTQLNNTTICSVIEFLSNILYIAIGGYFVFLGHLSIGIFVAFSSYSKNFVNSLNSIVGINTVFQPQVANLDRLKEFKQKCTMALDEDNLKLSLPAIVGNIELQNIYLTLNNKPVLNGVSVVFESKKRICLIGENGSGKTSLLNIISNVYSPDSGKIFFDENDLSNYKYKDICNNFSYALSKPILINSTILENILYFDGSNDIEMAEIVRLCQDINFQDDILLMPKGLETIIDDNNQLSTGQIQKIQLLRTMLREPPVVLLDEITANLDDRTKKTIYPTLFNKLKNSTIIAITHNLEELEHFDSVYEMINGKIFQK